MKAIVPTLKTIVNLMLAAVQPQQQFQTKLRKSGQKNGRSFRGHFFEPLPHPVLAILKLTVGAPALVPPVCDGGPAGRWPCGTIREWC